jgi:hypothetical protein
MTSGPQGVPNKRPCSLSMGTFGPAVDWVVAKRLREPIMGCIHPESLTMIFSEFGYTFSSFERLNYINVKPV